MFAQTLSGQHVAIKKVKTNSEEFRIIQYLRLQLSAFDRDQFYGVLPPLDLIELDDYHFVVTPR